MWCCALGVLCQVWGPTAINVHHLLEALRQQGELYTIGAEVGAALVHWSAVVLLAV
jgi:hypothetical protein